MASEETVKLRLYDPTVDHVGPKYSRVLDWLFNRRLWGVEINYCAWCHNNDYDVGGTAADRAVADDKFRICIYQTLVGFGKPKLFVKLFAKLAARRYYLGVRWGGRWAFNYRTVPQNDVGIREREHRRMKNTLKNQGAV